MSDCFGPPRGSQLPHLCGQSWSIRGGPPHIWMNMIVLCRAVSLAFLLIIPNRCSSSTLTEELKPEDLMHAKVASLSVLPLCAESSRVEVINVSADVKPAPGPATDNMKAAPAPTAAAAVPPVPATDMKAAPAPTTAAAVKAAPAPTAEAAVPPVPATNVKAAPAPTTAAAMPPGLIAVALFSSLTIVVRHNDKATVAADAKEPGGASPAGDVPIALPVTAIDPHGLWGLVVAVRGGGRCLSS